MPKLQSAADRRVFEASAALRAVIHRKRDQGELPQALLLAKLGTQARKMLDVSDAPEPISRYALQAFLSQSGDDPDVRAALHALGPLPPSPSPGLPMHQLRQRTALLLTAVAAATAFSAWAAYSDYSSRVMVSMAQAEPPPATVPAASLPPPATQPPKPVPIVIRMVGDIVLGSDFPANKLPDGKEQARLHAAATPLREADIAVGNLEGALTDSTAMRKDPSQPNQFAFRMPAAYAAMLKAMGLRVLNLANNHAMDFGMAGLKSTMGALRAEGLVPVGAGRENSMETVEVRGTSIVFLSYSYLPYFPHMANLTKLRQEIAAARRLAPIVLVNVHGGREGANESQLPDGTEYFQGEYRGNLREFAHAALDAGASAVLGHGPHILRPVEWYRGKPIFYSLGNFIGYRSLSAKGLLGYSVIGELQFLPDGQLLGTGIIPIRLDSTGVPSPDYSAATLAALNGMLDQSMARPPVLALPLQVQDAAADQPLLDRPTGG